MKGKNVRIGKLSVLFLGFISVAMFCDSSFAIITRGTGRNSRGSVSPASSIIQSLNAQTAANAALATTTAAAATTPLYTENTYDKAKAKRITQVCAAKYCNGYGDAFGKCFNTSSAEAILSSQCSDELAQTGDAVRATYDFIADMNMKFLEACRPIFTVASTDAEIFNGKLAKPDSKGNVIQLPIRQQLLYKKTRLGALKEPVLVVNYDVEFDQVVNSTGSVVNSSCVDNLQPYNDAKPPYVDANNFYCVKNMTSDATTGVVAADSGTAVSTDASGNCAADYTKATYSKPTSMSSCAKTMTVYENDGLYKYEQSSTYVKTDGRCPVYVGYGPLEKGKDDVKKGGYYPKTFYVGGANSGLICTPSTFGLSDDNMTYHVSIKNDATAMATLLTGSLSLVAGTAQALTAGVGSATMEKDAYVKGGCTKTGEITTAKSCKRNGGTCVFGGDGSGLIVDKTCSDQSGASFQYCEERKGSNFLSFSKSGSDGKYKKKTKGKLYTQEECDSVGGTFYSSANDRKSACWSYSAGNGKGGVVAGKNVSNCQGGGLSWIDVTCKNPDGKLDSSKFVNGSCSAGWEAVIDNNFGTMGYGAQKSEINEKLTQASSSMNFGNSDRCASFDQKIDDAQAKITGEDNAEQNKLQDQIFNLQDAKAQCLQRNGGSYIQAKGAVSDFNTAQAKLDMLSDTDASNVMSSIPDDVKKKCEEQQGNGYITCLYSSAQALDAMKQHGWTYDDASKTVNTTGTDGVVIKTPIELANNSLRRADLKASLAKAKYSQDKNAIASANSQLAQLDKEKAGFIQAIATAKGRRDAGWQGTLTGAATITQAVIANKANEHTMVGSCMITDNLGNPTGAMIANDGMKIVLTYDAL